jgi:hypothetical protein
MEHGFRHQRSIRAAAIAPLSGGTIDAAPPGTKFAVYIIHFHPILWKYFSSFLPNSQPRLYQKGEM